MKKITMYFISETNCEISAKNIKAAMQKGSAFQNASEENVIEIFASQEEAKNNFNYETEMKEFSDHNNKYIYIKEYAIIERVYNLDEVMKENEEIHNEKDFIEAIKKNPYDFDDNEIYEESEDIIEFSPRTFTAYIQTDERTIEKTFNNYDDAQKWVDENEDKYIDEGITKVGIDL